jgi:dipeptidyl aminopeptidase/acylaminoacyl peptidase
MKSHLFILDVTKGEARDLLPNAEYDMPPFPFGGSGDYTFSPDGTEIAFVAKTEANPAIHTNLDVFLVPVAGGEPKCITTEMKGQDSGALVWSPDGRYLTWGSMARARFESDQVDIVIFDRTTGEKRNLTEKFDRYVAEWAWAPDGKSIYAVVLNHGRRPIYQFPLNGSEAKEIVGGGYISGLQVSPDGATLVYAFRNLRTPSTVHAFDLTAGKSRELTPVNKELLATIKMGEVRDYWFDGANGDKVQVYVVLPPDFDPSKKYPLLQIIHGGPQQDYADLWTGDWNSQFFAARGYVVGLVCFHGTPGYGQAFTDSITKNWGGAPYEDMMKGTDFLIGLGFVDPERMAAGGGSYGGYLTNWIATQTNRFKALVSHAGLWNLESMYGATEELWFPEFELNGPYWEDRTLYDKWSPHRYAANLKTPMLITHGEQDFRVPVTQGLEIFTALRRQGVPATLVYYPDEHHWTQRSQNKAFWYKEFMKLLDTYVK